LIKSINNNKPDEEKATFNIKGKKEEMEPDSSIKWKVIPVILPAPPLSAKTGDANITIIAAAAKTNINVLLEKSFILNTIKGIKVAPKITSMEVKLLN